MCSLVNVKDLVHIFYYYYRWSKPCTILEFSSIYCTYMSIYVYHFIICIDRHCNKTKRFSNKILYCNYRNIFKTLYVIVLISLSLILTWYFFRCSQYMNIWEDQRARQWDVQNLKTTRIRCLLFITFDFKPSFELFKSLRTTVENYNQSYGKLCLKYY